MNKNIFAFTAAGAIYPEYISVNRAEDGGRYSITVRSEPKVTNGCYICGHAADKGQPGRCTPGDEHCNNYCNMAPEKGKMADAPLPCQQVTEGPLAVITLTPEQMQNLGDAILGEFLGEA